MLGDLWDSISGWLGDTFSSILESILNATIFRLFYYIERVLCWMIDLLYQMFKVFAGLVKVQYDDTYNYLINIFFANKAVSNIYWGMALIGFTLCIGFLIFAIVRKMFDSSGKIQQSIGQMIWSAIRSIVIIFGMTAIMNFVLNGTGILMQQVDLLFTDPGNLHLPVERSFTGEEYAAMGRVLCTIGNYSLVKSKDNRYNMNLCFNDIRADMYYLQQQNVFEYSYYETDKDGNVVQSWQSVLSKIAISADLRKDLKADDYNDGIVRSLKDAMEYLSTTAKPRPKQTITRSGFEDRDAHLDRMIFLMGTFRASKNPAFNDDPAFDDAIRGRYYYGDGKSIYNLDDVDSDFNIGFPTDYIIVWLASMAIIFDLVVIILTCIARIFNMLFLYLIAPPIIAATPLDNGGKTKQWMTAFIVQCLSVFGTVISMRLLLVFLPMIISPKLVLFDSAILNGIAKLILVYGGFEAAKKSSGIFTGILADSAGMQAIHAGDMSSTAGKITGMMGAAASFAAKPLTNPITSRAKKFGNWWSGLGDVNKKENSQQSQQNQKQDQQQQQQQQQQQKNESGQQQSNPSQQPNSGGPGGGSGPAGGPGGAGKPGAPGGAGRPGAPGGAGGLKPGGGGLPKPGGGGIPKPALPPPKIPPMPPVNLGSVIKK